MADISSITSLITSFRSETREEAITPEVLGALLQKIADLLGKAALQTDVSRLDNWRSDLARIGYVLTSLTIGSDDRNNVYFEGTEKVPFFYDQNGKCLRFVTSLSANRLNKAKTDRK